MSSRRTSSIGVLGQGSEAFSCGPVVFNFSTTGNHLQPLKIQQPWTTPRDFDLKESGDLHASDVGPSTGNLLLDVIIIIIVII